MRDASHRSIVTKTPSAYLPYGSKLAPPARFLPRIKGCCNRHVLLRYSVFKELSHLGQAKYLQSFIEILYPEYYRFFQAKRHKKNIA